MFYSFGHEVGGILTPQPGIEPRLPVLEAWNLNHWTTREVPESLSFYGEWGAGLEISPWLSDWRPW